jgi:hypothetical protein
MQRLHVNRTEFALIDDEDYERCKPLRWQVRKHHSRKSGRIVINRYVYSDVLRNGKKTRLLLARYIANCPPGQRVWFVNGNNLDCRKANLRVSGKRLVPIDAAFQQKHNLPNIETLLDEYENGS